MSENTEYYGIKENECFKKLENFLSKTTYLLTKTFDDYNNGVISRKSIYFAIIYKLAALIIIIRYGMSAIFNTQLILWLTSDANHILGNHSLISTVLSVGPLICELVIGNCVHYFVWERNLYVIEFLTDIKNYSNKYHLNERFENKYLKILKFFTNYMSEKLLWILSINAIILWSLPPFIAYFDSNNTIEYSLIISILWIPIVIVWTIDFYVVIICGFELWFLSLIYLKYQFIQVNEEIGLVLKLRSFGALEKSLKKHNSYCITLAKLNKTYCLMLFVINKWAKPVLNLLIYISLAPNVNLTTRLSSSVIFIAIISVIFGGNYLCSAVTSVAHLPRNTLYETFKFKHKIPIKTKIRISSFIEKLTDSTIGFYCYKFYPITHYEMYLSIAGWAANYFLIINLLKNNGVIN